MNVESDELPNEATEAELYEQPLSPLSVYATPYSEPEFPTRELPPIPVVSDNLANHTDTDGTGTEVSSGIDSHEPQSSPGILSNVSPSGTEEASSYSGLESSTREPPSSPVAYDELTKHEYVNTNLAAGEAMSDMNCDDPQSDPESPLYLIPSPDMETTV